MMAPRSITVGRRYHFRGAGLPYRVPFIRLSGRWLADAGFEEGDMVEVQVGRDSIILTRKADGPRPLPVQPELF